MEDELGEELRKAEAGEKEREAIQQGRRKEGYHEMVRRRRKERNNCIKARKREEQRRIEAG
jgi:hypothetical protein